MSESLAKILFENVAVFDGESPALRAPAHVLIEGNEIRHISAESIAARDAERIDGRGKTLMPGLIDNHVHVYLESLHLTLPEPPITYRAQYAHNYLEETLARGFTTIRDVAGGDHGLAMALRAGFVEGPRFYYGGLCLTQTGGHADMRLPSQPTDYCTCAAERNVLAIHADGVDECIKAAREELRKGASHIKIMGSGGVLSPNDPLERCQYSEAEIRAIVDECDRRGAYVCAHCHPTEAIRRCVTFGVRSIEHGTLIDRETAEFVAERGAYVVPTISVVYALVEDGERMGIPEISRQKLTRVHEHGIKMGFGTDLLGEQNARRGTEFTLRRQVLSAFDILHSATAVNAEILQMGGRLGVIKPGALADILLVDGNPLERIELLAEGGRHISHILKDGRFVKRPV
jgi:imidazolonepropionase-like amidohydrolase